MRIIAKRTLRDFWEQPAHRDAEQPLKAWYAEATNATWRTPADIKAFYRQASIVGDNRVVFNVAGNKYRLAVKFHYNTGVGYVRFVGTHEEYDRIDVEMV
jgi:mRNA interferase HigB